MPYLDVLFKLPNQEAMYSRINQRIKEVENIKDINFAVLSLKMGGDIQIADSVKQMDDEDILIEVWMRINFALKNEGIVATTADRDFLILIRDFDNIGRLVDYIGEIYSLFHTPFIVKGEKKYITVTIGCAIYPLNGQTEELLIANANAAMKKGKGGLFFYDDYVTFKLKEQVKLGNDLNYAIKNNELEVYYQPQINSVQGTMVGMEALIRWNHPLCGVLGANKFIPLAEQNGLIMEIDKWVILSVCSQLREWKNSGIQLIPISINISAYLFSAPDLVNYIAMVIEQTEIEPRYIKIELTETVPVKEIDSVIEIMEKISSLGIKFSIDDFGKEYASFNYIKKMPIDTIKIEKEFVDGINHNVKDESIIKAIINLAKDLHLNVVAEGIETKEQADFLKQLGCNIIQGYYFYRPMPASRIKQILRKIP